MESIAWLVPGPADGQRPPSFTIGVAIPLSGYLVSNWTVRAGHRTARR
jgi:hypothetical protein